MASSTITKAQLETQLQAAQARIAELEQAATPAPAEERRDQLEQVVWLQREAPSFEKKTLRYAADGETLLMRVGYQYSSLNKRTGQRQYGERRWLTVIGDTAESLRHLMETSDTRLVRIGAYESPQPPAEDGTRRSEWVLARFEPMPRTAPAAAGDTIPEEAVPF